MDLIQAKGLGKRKDHIKGGHKQVLGEDLTADGMWKDRVELKTAYEKLGSHT